MPNRLELPDDLAALVEKREQERREAERRRLDGKAESVEIDRRTGQERRAEPRRADDAPPE